MLLFHQTFIDLLLVGRIGFENGVPLFKAAKLARLFLLMPCQETQSFPHLAGSASRGLYRVHQFSKVEMFVVCKPDQSEAILNELCQIEEEMFNDLGLHFRVLVSTPLP